MTSVAITGASGFIGQHLIAEARRRGEKVIALSRSGINMSSPDLSLPWTLDQIPPIMGLSIDCAIHLAHDFQGEAGAQRTIDGTLKAIQTFREAGARRQVFYSSISSGTHAVSLYGRTKFAIEQRLRDQPDITILRPGLVLGNGGIYGRIRQWIELFPIVPLPDGGYGDMPVIQVERLCRKTFVCLGDPDAPRDKDLYEPELKSLRTLIIGEAALMGRKLWIVPIPSRLLLIVLATLERLHFPLPVTADNLKGFLANQTVADRLKGRKYHDVA